MLKTGRLNIIGLMKNLLLLSRWPLQAKNYKLFYLRGQVVDQVAGWIEEAWKADIKRRIYSGWGPAIEWLKSRDAHIVLLSGTPKPLAEPLMRHFQISDAICAEPELVDQRYTGRLLRPHPKSRLKLIYAEEWLKGRGFNWEDTAAIANDWPDRFLFNRARPIAVHPSRRLLRLAYKRHWQVVRNPGENVEMVRALQRLFNP